TRCSGSHTDSKPSASAASVTSAKNAGFNRPNDTPNFIWSRTLDLTYRQKMGLLEGKVAIVTGSAHGIGRGHALELAKHGAKVVVNDLGCTVRGDGASEQDADAVVQLIKERGGEAVADYSDVADFEAAGRMIQTAVDSF